MKEEEEAEIETDVMSEFDRRLLYSMELAIISRAEAEGLLYPDEVISLKVKISEAYREETGHWL